MQIQAMILSDLHFGDDNSVLHSNHPDRDKTLKNLIREIDKRLEDTKNRKGRKIPYLILNGDIYDLSFAEYKFAFADAQRFFKELKGFNLFDRIIFIPGNHDHHLWWLFQKERLVMDPIRRKNPVKIELLPHIHSAFIELDSCSLSYYQSYPALEGTTFLDSLTGHGVKIVYPNIYLIYKENIERKAIVVTHGHFFESMWTLSTDIFPKNLAKFGAFSPNLYFLEKINSAFTEFGWHALGQTGPLSRMIEKTYEQVSIGNMAILNDVIDEFGDYLDRVIDFKTEKKWKAIVGYFKEKSTDALLAVALEILRQGIKKYIKSTNNVSSKEARLRYTNVLKEKDLLKQIADYLDLSKKDCQHLEITDLVFAHTHDACFKQRVKDDRLENITFYNTGGFVKKDGYEPEWRLLSVLEDGHII